MTAKRLYFFLGAMLSAWFGGCLMLAQTHYVPHVHIGGHAGVSMSKISFYPQVEQKLYQGLNFGLSFRYAEERHVGLLVELNFDQRGWKEDFDDKSLDYSRRLTYIELPVMTHIFFGSRVVKCIINLGPQIGYMISDNISSNFDYMAAEPEADTPFYNRRTEQMKMPVKNKFDYGIAGGAGVEFVIKKRHSLLLEGRYYFGLGSIFPDSKKDTFSASRATSIMVSLGYMFRFK